jgi:hypothetical protein
MEPLPWTVRKRTRFRHLSYSAPDGFGNVVKLEVEEHLFALRLQLADHFHSGGRVEFHTYLIEADVAAQARD